MNTQQITDKITALRTRGAWATARKTYALELLESLDGEYTPENLLNGARTWSEYSYGGNSLIYDADVAERVCSPSELKRTRGGERPPSKDENWLDCQARCLSQAARLIAQTALGA
jgi:hypothetical protein